MKKISVYLDTSVIGGCFDEEFEEYSRSIIHEIETGKYRGVISDVTIAELNSAPGNVKGILLRLTEGTMTVLSINDDIIALAQKYLDEKIVTENFFEDALHIACATVNTIDLLISWNFKHIVNYNRINQFNYEI